MLDKLKSSAIFLKTAWARRKISPECRKEMDAFIRSQPQTFGKIDSVQSLICEARQRVQNRTVQDRSRTLMRPFRQ